MSLVKPKSYSVKEAAEMAGLSERVVRLHCAAGDCPSEYHEFPGTTRGFYLLTDKSVRWLKEHVSPRNRSSSEDGESSKSA